jgi:membrane protease YdiL (CAAX protease family)
MTGPAEFSKKDTALFRRHPVVAYFTLTFTISWLGAWAVAAPHLLRHESLPKMSGILMFPLMLLGPCLTSLILTGVIDGKSGLRELSSRMMRWRISARWYAALVVPPALVLMVLLCLKTFVSPAYTPNRFYMGILFGAPAGLLEEIGWMGFAFPRMRARSSALAASILLGLLWSVWHVPVIDYLGTATPHGIYWLAFFLAFAAAMTAMRVLIAWIYSNTRSVLLAQITHISSTGALVIFSAPRVNARQEALWYGIYASALWVLVAIVVKIFGKNLTRQA